MLILLPKLVELIVASQDRGKDDGITRVARAETRGTGSMGATTHLFSCRILISAPVGLTIYLAWKFISWVDETVFGVIPVQYNPGNLSAVQHSGIGLIIIVVYLDYAGRANGRLFGRLAQQVMGRF